MSFLAQSQRRKLRTGKWHGPHCLVSPARKVILLLLKETDGVPLLVSCSSKECVREAVFPVLPCPGVMAKLVCRLPSCLAPQDQLKQLQEILGSLSLQEEKTRASQRHLDQQVNSEAQQSISLITQLRAMVAEREAKVQQLELEIGQLSVQVSRALAWPGIHFQALASPSTVQTKLSNFHCFPPTFTQATPRPPWLHSAPLLPSGFPRILTYLSSLS